MNLNNNMHFDEEFVKNKSKNIDKQDVEKLDKKKGRLRKLLNLSVFATKKEKIKLLFEIVQQYRKGIYKKIPWRSISAIVFTLLYIINPLDIIPDILPFFGFIDDLSVFVALSGLVEKDIELYKNWKDDQAIDITPLNENQNLAN